ncbi:MAG TPA: tetratricopeptide repeat protein, partial [Anaerolineae bacterium]|nr:tetratricopeptide repeat protein [Anaerolineae bacterium]
VQPEDPGVLRTIWYSLTRSRGEPSLVILALLTITWVMIGLMGLCDLAIRAEAEGRKAADWLTAVGAFALISLLGVSLFALLHAPRVRPLSITSPDAPIPLADTYTFYIVFLLLTMIALALVLVFLSPARRTARPWRWTNAPGDFAVAASLIVLPLAAVALMFTTNINGVRADILFKQGQGLESAKQWDAALFFYDKALALAPHEDFYYLFQARSFMDKGTKAKGDKRDELFQKSADAMVRAWEEAPLNTDHPRNLAKLYLAWGNTSEGEKRQEKLEKALEYSDAARRLSPNNAQILNERGQIYAVMGDLDKAIEAYQASLELDDQYVQTYLLLGEAYMAQKKWEEAAQAYEKAIELKEKTQSAYRGLGYVYSQLGDTEAALKVYERAVELWPKSFEDRKNLAILYQQMGRLDDALREARVALELAPQGQKQAMQNFVAQLEGRSSASPADSKKVQELIAQGQAQVQDKDWQAAQQTFEQVIALDANNAVAHSMLAYIYAKQGRLEEAITENQTVLRLAPNDYNSYKNLAILYQQKGDLAPALDAAEQALKLAPESEKQALQTYIEQLKQAQGSATPAAPPQRAGDLSPQERNDMYSNPPEMIINPNKSYQATIVTKKGNIVVDLDAADAPQTVNNFVFLAKEGFYDGLTFHRVENQPGFALIQGGDPTGTGRGGPGYTVPAEIGLPHDAGAIAMARLPDQVNPERASSGSQFYICLVPIHQLDGGYTVFGYVVEGLDVAKKIAVGDEILTIVISEK